MKKFLFLISLLLPLNLFSQNVTDSVKGLLSSYQYKEALQIINQEMWKNHDDKTLYKWRGYALKGLMKYPEAVNAFETAYKNDTTNYLLLIEIGNCYKAFGNFDKSLTTFQKALQFSPGNFYIKSEIAGNYLQKEEYLPARDNYLALYRTDTTNIFLLRTLAKCYDALHRPDSSMIFYQKLLAIIPYDVQAVVSLANVYIDLRVYPKVIEITEYYRIFNKKNPKVNRLHAYGYYLTEKYPRSLQFFRTCLNQHDTSLFVYRYMGFCYFHMESYDSAKIFLEKAFLMDTLNSNLCYPLGISCTLSKYKHQGVYYLKKALELVTPVPSLHSEMLQHLSVAYNQQNKFQLGLKSLLEALQITPDDTLLKFRIALQYQDQLHNPGMAIRYYKEFLKTRSDKKNSNPANRLVVSYYSVAEQRLKELETKK